MRSLITVVLLCALACHHSRETGDVSVLASEDSVIRVALSHEASELSEGDRLRVASEIPALFASEADARAWVDSSRGLMRTVPPEMLLVYALANRETRRVDVPDRVANHTVEKVSQAAPDVAGTPVITLSRVGFTGRGDSAVVMTTRRCGPLCGSSQLLLAMRDAGRWRIARSLWHVSF
jgi:hypothetical protein